MGPTDWCNYLDIIQLLDAVFSRRQRNIKWMDDSTPVFYAWTVSRGVNFSKPANGMQQNTILRRAADLISMIGKPRFHEKRRGAASDLMKVSCLKDTSVVRRYIGHSMKTAFGGLTEAYAGLDPQNTWAVKCLCSHRRERRCAIASRADQGRGLRR